MITDFMDRQVHSSHDPEPDGIRLYPGGQSCRACRYFVAYEGVLYQVTGRGAATCRPDNQTQPPGAADTPVRRMRVYRGRVMHVVQPGPMTGWLRSACAKTNRYKETKPRVYAPTEQWSDERYWYPDCTHCPAGAC